MTTAFLRQLANAVTSGTRIPGAGGSGGGGIAFASCSCLTELEAGGALEMDGFLGTGRGLGGMRKTARDSEVRLVRPTRFRAS